MGTTRQAALTWEIPGTREEPAESQLSVLKTKLGGISKSYGASLLSDQLKPLMCPESIVEWVPVISRLANEAASLLSPSTLTAHGDIDPRNYIEVIELPGTGSPAESRAISGVVLFKNVTHKRMGTSLQHPRVMLLAGALEFKGSSLSSLDSLLQEEKLYLEKVVDQIASFKPKVVLVEKSASRLAQEMLLDQGIALVLNVSRDTLDRLSLCLGSEVATGVEALTARNVGFCKDFELEMWLSEEVSSSEASSAGAHTIMIFSGCPRPLGVSIILKGPSAGDMELLRGLLKEHVFAAYWNRLEGSFLSTWFLAAASLSRAESTQTLSDDVFVDEARQAVEACWRSKCAGPANKGAWLPSPYISFYKNGSGMGSSTNNSTGTEQRTGSTQAGEFPEPKTDSSSTAEPARNVPLESNRCIRQLPVTVMCKNPTKGVLCEAAHELLMRFYDKSDLSLGAFVSQAAPVGMTCPHPECGEGAFVHLRNFMHGDSVVTLSCKRLADEEKLPDDRLWMWLRPLHAHEGPTVRVAFDADTACISFAHTMALLLDLRNLRFRGEDFQDDFVNYVAIGSVVLCFHYSRAKPYSVDLPAASMQWSSQSELGWLRAEAKELIEEVDMHFSSLEEAIHELWKDVPATASAESEWMNCVGKTREALLQLVKIIKQKLGSENSSLLDAIPKLVWELNSARRKLELLIREWLTKLGIVQPELTMAISPVKKEEAQPSPPVPEEKETSTAEEKPRHRRGDSSNFAEQFARMYARADQTGPEPVAKYATPALRESYEGAAGGLSEDTVDFQTIPTGLVARYIARFQEPQPIQSDWAKPSPPGDSPIASPLRRKSMITNVEVIDGDDAQWANMTDPLGKSDGLDALLNSIKSLRDPQQGALAAQESSELESHFDSWKMVLPEETAENIKQAANTATPKSVSTKENNGTPKSAGEKSALDKLPLSTGGNSLLPAEEGRSLTIFDGELTSFVAYALSTRQFAEFIASEEEAREKASEGGDGLSDREVKLLTLRCDEQLDCKVVAPSIAGSTEFQVLAYYAPQFAALRSLCIQGGEESFLASVSRCRKWESKGGKSNVYFAKSRDERFVIKELSRLERHSFLDTAPSFLSHWGEAVESGHATSLAKIFGIFQVSYKSAGPSASGKMDSVDFIIMENVFYNREVQRVYDLKGSERDRYVSKASESGGTVLLDENLKEISLRSPLSMTSSTFVRLRDILQRDTEFLSELDVMDYSLLIGVDKDGRMLVLGIIDFIRQFTLDKALEMYVKKSGLLGGRGKDPTILSPKQYAKRFRQAMPFWFVSVPVGIE